MYLSLVIPKGNSGIYHRLAISPAQAKIASG